VKAAVEERSAPVDPALHLVDQVQDRGVLDARRARRSTRRWRCPSPARRRRRVRSCAAASAASSRGVGAARAPGGGGSPASPATAQRRPGRRTGRARRRRARWPSSSPARTASRRWWCPRPRGGCGPGRRRRSREPRRTTSAIGVLRRDAGGRGVVAAPLQPAVRGDHHHVGAAPAQVGHHRPHALPRSRGSPAAPPRSAGPRGDARRRHAVTPIRTVWPPIRRSTIAEGVGVLGRCRARKMLAETKGKPPADRGVQVLDPVVELVVADRRGVVPRAGSSPDHRVPLPSASEEYTKASGLPCRRSPESTSAVRPGLARGCCRSWGPAAPARWPSRGPV
jgi:hypothetical protein